MSRAEMRRQKRETEKSKTATYNLTQAQLDAMIDAVDSFAIAFATADYNLWHANQAARYNILHGVKAVSYTHLTLPTTILV